MEEKRSGIITLSTDFGLADPYVGVMKGVILSIYPQARLVDLTHALSHQRLLEAAFILHSAYAYFPPGTVHLTVVDPGVGGNRRLIVVQDPQGFWVGPDNGVLTLVIKNRPSAKVYRLTQRTYFLPEISSTFHGRDIMAPAAAHLCRGTPAAALGEPIDDPHLLEFPEPRSFPDRIIGQVLWVDHFGNLITNIAGEMIARKASSGRPWVKIGELTLPGIHSTYSEVPPQEKVALIGSSGYLEIALNQGRAADLLGFHPDRKMTVTVLFGSEPATFDF